jgi:uncharacterized protein (TIGR02001 family)
MNASRVALLCGISAIAFAALAAPAVADGYEVSAPAAPAPEERKFTYSFNIGGTSDYVFRGISQSSNDPAIQGGADLSYGIFYAGTWASRIDFDDAPPANAEVDWYGGIRPTWKSPFGDMNIDLGVIYYSYPDASPAPGADPNYVEGKAGYSWSPLHPSLTTGTTVFYSPNYFAETGPVWTVETFASLNLPKFAIFSAPVLNGLVGWQRGSTKEGYFVNVIQTDNQYYYWNAGLALPVDNLTFDLRYWDTNIGGDAAGICAFASLCASKFVFSVKVVVP